MQLRKIGMYNSTNLTFHMSKRGCVVFSFAYESEVGFKTFLHYNDAQNPTTQRHPSGSIKSIKNAHVGNH